MNYNKPQSSCLGCKERVADPNCHTTCEKYIAFRKGLDDFNEKQYVEKKMYMIAQSIESDRMQAVKDGTLYKNRYYAKKRREKI